MKMRRYRCVCPGRTRTPRRSAVTAAAPPRRGSRRGLVIGAIPVLLAGAGLLSHTARPGRRGLPGRLHHQFESWPGGFGANVTINNLGDAVDGWRLTWSFGAGQQITQMWNATLTQSGSAVTATNVGYNGSIPTGGSAAFGFNGSWTRQQPGAHVVRPERRDLHRHPAPDHPHPHADLRRPTPHRRRPTRHVRSSVDVPLDLDRPAGEPEVGVGLAQGLHQRRLQRQAPRLRHDARHRDRRGAR